MDDEPEKISFKTFIWETAKTVFYVGLLAVLIRAYLIQPFIVSGQSMEPNFHNNDYLLIDKLTFRVREPKRGEIVVFRYPKNPRENYIKRIIGLPGETVIIDDSDNSITITNADHPNGMKLTEDYLSGDEVTKALNQQGRLSLTLQADEYFVLGDNRDSSQDSRYFGKLNRSYFVGRSLIRLLPLSQIRVYAAPASLSQ